MMKLKKFGRIILLGAVLLLVNLALINLVKESNSMAGRKGTLKNEVEVAQAKVAKKAKVTGKKDSKVTVTGKKEEAKKAEVAGKNKEATKVTVKALKVTATGKKLPEGKKLTKKLLKKVVKVTAVKKNGKVVTINKYSCPQLGKKVNYNKSGYKVTVKYAGKSESIAVKVKKAKVTVKDLQAYKVNKLTEGKKLTKKAVRSSIKVIAVYGNGNVKLVGNYDCDQIGQMVTYKEEYPHKGQFQLTIKYAGLSKNIWIGVEKKDEESQPTSTPNVTSTPEPTSTQNVTSTPAPTSSRDLQVFAIGKLKEDEVLTKNMLQNCISVVEINNGNIKFVDEYVCNQIGQRITVKEEYPHRGQFCLTISYNGLSNYVWVWVERNDMQKPTTKPTQKPIIQPTQEPTTQPTQKPITQPTQKPTTQPTQEPTTQPTQKPTIQPTQEPTTQPTQEPTTQPTQKPTIQPTQEPTIQPTQKPTTQPTQEPTIQPTQEPTTEPIPATQAAIVVSKTGNGRILVDDTEVLKSVALEKGEHKVAVQSEKGWAVKSWSINGEEQKNNTVTINLSENMTIEVVFEEIPRHTMTITRIGEGKLFISGEEVTFDENGKAAVEFEVGLYNLANKAGEGFKFSGYTFNGRELSQEATATISITDKCNLTVTFIEEETNVTVEYKNFDGSTLKKTVVAIGEAPEPPTAPKLTDKEFEGWKLNDILYGNDNINELLNAIKALTIEKKDVEIFTSYKEVDKYYTITVIDATLKDSEGKTIEDGRIQATTKFFVNAPEEKEGRKFAYYKDETGNILGYRAEYQGFANSDRVIKAVYSDKEIPPQPIVAFTKDVEVDYDTPRLVYDIRIDVPLEYAVLQWGVELSIEYSDGTSESKLYAMRDSTANDNYAKSQKRMKDATATAFAKGATVTARVYAEIQKEGNIAQFIYSAPMKTVLEAIQNN